MWLRIAQKPVPRVSANEKGSIRRIGLHAGKKKEKGLSYGSNWLE